MEAPLYHFMRSRRQHARLFITMAVACLLYLGLFHVFGIEPSLTTIDTFIIQSPCCLESVDTI